MTFTPLLAQIFLLAQFLIPTDARLQGAPPATQPTAAGVAATRPVGEATARNPATFQDAFASTTVGQLFEGKKTLSPQELIQFQFWLNAVKDLGLAAIGFVPRIFVALVFLLVFWLIYRGFRKVAVGSMSKANVDPSLRDMMGTLIKWAVMGFGLVIAFNQVGVQITALLTGVSIIGLAVGFAAQETLANFIAGVVIFWDKPFKVDDWVETDGVFGRVLRITFRSTRLLTGDGTVIVMPNTQMLSKTLSNHSTHPVQRISVPIGIAYKESIDHARSVMLATTTGDARLCKEPAPKVVVTACADSSVNLQLSFWIEDESIEKKIYAEYLEKLKNALDKAGIQIPFPHMQIFIEDTPAMRLFGGNNQMRAAS
jgi:small conductance mechanosensitive channel